MATGGWGAVGGGAWGGTPGPAPAEDDSPRSPPAPQPKQPAFGANQPASFRANPVAEPSPSFKTSNSQQFGAFGGAYGNSSAGSATAAGGAGRPMTEAELRKKEAELNAREKQLAEREKELGVTAGKKPNWPICFPVWRHDIGEDIPEGSRRVVREAYMCWWFLVAALSYQFFCGSVMLGYPDAGSEKVPSWFLTIIYWLCGVPGAIYLWYKRLYVAARDDGTFGFVTFFVMFFLHWAFCVFCAIGPQINAARWSFSGFLAGIDAFSISAFAGTVFMIGGAVWTVLAIYSMWVLRDVWYFFRGQGGVQEVQQKVAQEAALAAFRQQQGGGNASSRV